MSRITSRLQPCHIDAAGVVLMLAAAAACYTFLAQPLLDARTEARALSVELAMQRDALSRKRAARQEVESRLAAVRADVSAQSVQLEPRSQVNHRLARLTRLAADAGIGVERLSPGSTSDGPRHGTMSFRLSGKAPYPACETFVARLHRAFNDMAVTMLRLSAIPDSREPVTVELELLWFTAPDVKVEPR